MKKVSVHPAIIQTPASKKDARSAASGIAPDPARRRNIRMTWLVFVLVLPFLALWTAEKRMSRLSDTMVRTMMDGYEKRFGMRVPESLGASPLLALKDKARSAPAGAGPTSASLQTWLSVVDRLSGQAGASGLRLDAVSLDLVRVEIRGSAADLQSVAVWVSGLSSDPALADAALVSSEVRMSDKRTTFKVRARLKIRSEDVKS